MTSLPFSSVVGQDDAKLALLLATVEPRLGGVLLRGDKGSAKTTLARGLAALLAPDAPFVELPLGASEDRVVGALDVGALLGERSHAFRPGLLAAAHGGVLYVDEVNLLADHLVDTLLDVAVSGVNRVERDGFSETHPARFVLVGSMNPEEGELRPQLLDRFGLAVEVRATTDPAERAEIVGRQLAHDRGSSTVGDGDAVLAGRLAAAEPASVDREVIAAASRLAVAVGAEGLRADLSLCRAGAALAGWEGRTSTELDDIRRVAPLVLAHRRRRDPFDAPGLADEELSDALDDSLGAPPPDQPSVPPPPSGPSGPDETALPDPASIRLPPAGPRPRTRQPASRGRSGSAVAAPTGRVLRAEPYERPGQRLAAAATAVAATVRDPDGAALERADLRAVVAETPRTRLVVVAVDASGSMAGRRRLDLARAAVLGLLGDAYRHRDRVAMVAFAGQVADVVLRPTGSVEVARARLADVPTGGTTPLAAGLRAVSDLVRAAAHDGSVEPVVVVITDGRATAGGDDPLESARDAAADLAATGRAGMVLDAESGPVRLGLARELATTLRAEHVELDTLADGGDVEQAIRSRLGGRP